MEAKFSTEEMRSMATQLRGNGLLTAYLLDVKQSGINAFVSTADPDKWAEYRQQVHFTLNLEQFLKNCVEAPEEAVEAAE